MEELLDLKRRLEQERPADWRELPDIDVYKRQERRPPASQSPSG